ncbi:MAG: PLP-dependent aminotransferase family protein [Chloroflexi bacterium]|nr:PLP-dependent aminotransferase family protein [Chloroflexota bacterium]
MLVTMNEMLVAALRVVDGDVPAYQQIATRLAVMIRDGSLPPGERLPPDRTLARALGLSRTTIVAAYDELKAAGLVRGRQGSGTYVARDLGPGEMAWTGPTTGSAALAARGGPGRMLSLAHAMPPTESIPMLTLLHLMTEVSQEQPELLAEYQPAEGSPALRHELARLLAGWGVPARPAEIQVLSGSQQGIDLIARLLLRPGDYVAVEAHTYGGALAAFRAAGARLLPVPYDRDGMDVEALTSLLGRYPVRFIYTMPTYHNPTGATMPLAHRRALLEAAARQATPIVEDNLFDQLYFDQPPPPSLKALDRDGLVLALGSASKIISAGLRLGWLVAPPQTIEQVARLKRAADLQANNLAQVGVQRFLAAGLLEPHLAALRHICRARAERLTSALQTHLPELAVARPRGGLSLWLRLPDGVSAEAVLEEALARGVSFMPGSWFSVNGCDDGSLRLCYANPPADQLDEAIGRLAGAVRAVATRGAVADRAPLSSQMPLV